MVESIDSSPGRQPLATGRAFAMRDRWLLGALALCSAALAWPLLSSQWVPYLDLPQHVGAVAILSGADPQWRLHDYYDIDLLSSPYLLPYLIAAALAKLFGAVAAVKCMFALAAVTLPWAVAFAASRFGRDPRVALIAAPLSYGTFAFMGFLNFVLSLPLWLAWLGWWRGAVDEPQFTTRQWLLGAGLSVALFYGHVMTLGFAAGCCFVVTMLAQGPAAPTEWSSLRRRMARATHFLPGLSLFVAWATLSPVAHEGELGRMLGASKTASAPKWAEPLDALKSLIDYTLSAYHDNTDEWLLLGAGLLFGATWVARRRPAPMGSDRERVADRILPALLLSAIGLAVALPESYRGIWPIGARMAPFVVLVALLLPRGAVVWPRVALAAGVVLAALTAQTHSSHFARFGGEVGDVRSLIEKVDPGRRTMTLIFRRNSDVVQWPAFLHFSQYIIAEKGGVAEFSFVNFTKSPIHYAQLNAPPRNPIRFEWTPERFDLRAQHDAWDYVLIRGDAKRARSVFGAVEPWPEIGEADGWRLYQRP